jgi:hypothetical protein
MTIVTSPAILSTTSSIVARPVALSSWAILNISNRTGSGRVEGEPPSNEAVLLAQLLSSHLRNE